MQNRIFKTVFLIIFSFVFMGILSGQGYYIEEYLVEIDIQPNGSVQVAETIHLNFNEERHGIYRDIPTTYKNRSASSGDAILLENVEVVGDPFLLMKETGLLRIRIGSPHEKVRGKKKYQINYTVLGAVEQFNTKAEFSWNVIGDRWDTHIEEIDVTIRFPFEIKNLEDNLLLNIKNRPVLPADLDIETSGKRLKFKFDNKLKAREGVSLALRFPDHKFPTQEVPASVISDNYFIQKSDVDIALDESGQIVVNEQHYIHFKDNASPIVRTISSLGRRSDQYDMIYPYPDMMSAKWNGKKAFISGVRSENLYRYHVPVPNNVKKGLLQLDYILNGAISSMDDEVSLSIDLASFASKSAVDTIEFKISFPENARVKNIPQLNGFVLHDFGNNHLLYVRRGFLTGPIRQSFKLLDFDIGNLTYPKESLYSTRLIDDMTVVVSCEKGNCTVEQTTLMQDKLADTPAKYFIGKKINTKSFPYEMSSPSWLNSDRSVAYKKIKEHPDFDTWSNDEYGYAVNYSAQNGSRFHIEYSVDQIVTDGQLIVPVYFPQDVPIDHLSVIIENAEGEIVHEVDESGLLMSEVNELEIIKHEGFMYLAIPIDANELDNKTLSIGSILKSNGRFIGSILLSILFYVLWFRYGRDQKFDGSMHSHPPAYMTPAEAGYLWDRKLHGRDLISLIYHWAARDLIAIEEIKSSKGKSDYILEKIEELPKEALEYEKILFNRLFTAGEDRVKVSSLKNSFYKTMTSARKELKKEFERKHMYEPFTRGIGTLFIIVGFLVIAAGFVVLGLHAGQGDFSWSLPMLIVGMSMLFFGYYLPKKTALGSSYFIALQKFDKFIDDAPPEELSKLYESDSNYFQNTLAYAIVLGKAKEWAKRFDGLLEAPPSYYRGYNRSEFSPMIFTNDVISGMRTMEKDFYSTPAPSGGSSSYSGGRSSSFGGGGGFSSGGGFGGGGGSSW